MGVVWFGDSPSFFFIFEPNYLFSTLKGKGEAQASIRWARGVRCIVESAFSTVVVGGPVALHSCHVDIYISFSIV